MCGQLCSNPATKSKYIYDFLCVVEILVIVTHKFTNQIEEDRRPEVASMVTPPFSKILYQRLSNCLKHTSKYLQIQENW